MPPKTPRRKRPRDDDEEEDPFELARRNPHAAGARRSESPDLLASSSDEEDEAPMDMLHFDVFQNVIDRLPLLERGRMAQVSRRYRNMIDKGAESYVMTLWPEERRLYYANADAQGRALIDRTRHEYNRRNGYAILKRIVQKRLPTGDELLEYLHDEASLIVVLQRPETTFFKLHRIFRQYDDGIPEWILEWLLLTNEYQDDFERGVFATNYVLQHRHFSPDNVRWMLDNNAFDDSNTIRPHAGTIEFFIQRRDDFDEELKRDLRKYFGLL